MIENVRLSDLLARSTQYDRWRGPIDPRLRWTALASGPVICVGLCGIAWLLVVCLPRELAAAPGSNPRMLLAIVLGVALAGLVVLDVCALLLYIAMLVTTRLLEAGRPHWHWIAWGESILGALHGFVLAFALSAVIVAVVLCGILVIAALVALMSMAAE